MLAVGRAVLGEGPLELEDVTFHDALFMQEEQSVQLETVLEPERGQVRVHSRVRDAAPEWTLRATARVRSGASNVTPFQPFTVAATPVAREAFYAHAQAQGHEYGPTFQGLAEVRGGDGAASGTVELPAALEGKLERYVLHPAILDACLQVGFALQPIGGAGMLLGDPESTTDALVQALAAGGVVAIRALPGDAFAAGADGGFGLRPESAEDMAALIDRVLADHPDLAGIVHLWGLAELDSSPPDGAALLAAQGRRVLSALHLVQALARHEAAAPRLYIATRGAHVLPGETPPAALDVTRLAQAPLLGFARTAANEQPQLRLTVVDVDPETPGNGEGAAADLMVEIAADSPELEVAIRGVTRFVNRVDAVALEGLPRRKVQARVSATTDYRLTMTAPGLFNNMLVTETQPVEAGPGEAVIAVEAVGINFHDILSAAGMMPEGAEDVDAWQFLGLECAGIVRAVGAGVAHLRPGDRVIGPGKGCLGSAVRMAASAVQKLPNEVSFVEGATLPTAFMTAHYALNHLGRMAFGERVLIHVATGGVGLAAIQLARLAGCEIFATAGSEVKRDYLRRLGITQVMDSRSLDFADEVMAATGGRGVDIVLNSLPGPFIDKGLAILAPYGRFLEMGKRDLFADKPIGLRALRSASWKS